MVAHGVYDILALETFAETRTPVDVGLERQGDRGNVALIGLCFVLKAPRGSAAAAAGHGRSRNRWWRPPR